MVNITTETLLDLKQAAQRCGVSVKTVRNWSSRMTSPLETAKIGGKVVTTLEALQRFTVQRATVVHEQRQMGESLRARQVDLGAQEEIRRMLLEEHGVKF